MQCADFKKLLSRFLEHELDEAQEKILKQHLEGCPACSRSLASLQKMVNIMRRMDNVAPPLDLISRVNQKLDQPGWWEQARRQVESWGIMKMPYPAIAVSVSFVLALFLSHYVTSISPLGKGISATARPVVVAKNEIKREPVASSIPPPVAQALEIASPVSKPEIDQQFASMRVPAADMKIVLSERSFGQREDAPMLLGEVPAAPAAAQKAPSLQKSADRTETMSPQPGNLIVANRQQNWRLTVASPIGEAQDRVITVLKDMRAQKIKRRTESAAKQPTAIFSFVVNYGQLSQVIEALQNIGPVERLTALPIPRPEAYMGTQGMPNPQVLEEQIPVELTIVR